MKKSVGIGIGLVVIACGSGYFVYKKYFTHNEVSWKTVEITRGTVQNVISSTGSLNPVSTVEIGTQVSGIIIKVFADYNDVVRKNQIIAEIDREPLQIKLTQVQAAYLRNEALFERTKSVSNRDSLLHEKELISDEEFLSSKTDYLAQKASLESAKADVETARTNLTYTTIRSPVDGTVIKRNVEVGQTVAASLSSPILFIIAEDLQKMKILADVDESDIGEIKTGQEVSFSVPAYPDKTYGGEVSQIRLQPEIIQNVVSYTVVIKASNPDGSLLPGMTANVDFIAEKAEDVLTVSSAALRFKPSEDIIAQFRSEMQRRVPGDGQRSDTRGTGLGGRSGSADQIVQNRQNRSSQNMGTIWLLTSDNQLRPAVVKIGLSDGTMAEITGRDLAEGTRVVTGVLTSKDVKSQAAPRSLFSPSRNTSANRSSNRTSAPPPPGGF